MSQWRFKYAYRRKAYLTGAVTRNLRDKKREKRLSEYSKLLLPGERITAGKRCGSNLFHRDRWPAPHICAMHISTFDILGSAARKRVGFIEVSRRTPEAVSSQTNVTAQEVEERRAEVRKYRSDPEYKKRVDEERRERKKRENPDPPVNPFSIIIPLPSFGAEAEERFDLRGPYADKASQEPRVCKKNP